MLRVIYLTMMVTIFVATVTEVYGVGNIPPPPGPKRYLGGEVITLVDWWLQYTWMSIDVFEDWDRIDSGTLQCGASTTITRETQTGVEQTVEKELISKVGAELGVEDLGKLSSEISKKTGTRITISRKDKVSRTWTMSAPPDGELDYALYQKVIEIRFQYHAGGLVNKQWTHIVRFGLPDFRLLSNLTPQVHNVSRRTAWMDFFVRVVFNYVVPAILEDGTRIERAETLTIIHPANLTREGLIEPIGWRAQYRAFGERVVAPDHLPQSYVDFMLGAKSIGVLEHSWGAPHVQPTLPAQLKLRVPADTGFAPIVLVTDVFDTPIENATVQFDDLFNMTDRYGVAYFPSVNITEVKLIQIVATKSGYINASLEISMHPRRGIFLAKYAKLETAYGELREDYDSLKAAYDKLKLDYDSLKATHNKLASDYKSLTSDYAKLELEHKSTTRQLEMKMGELATNTNLMYLFIITTIAFIATTVYFAKRKPKTT